MKNNANILIVEDDARAAGAMKNYLLSKENVETAECASSVAEAHEMLSVINADLVVLDLIMSVNDGYSFLENIKRMHEKEKPSVIVISAINSEGAIKKAFDMGAKYYMVKPCENEVLYKRIVDVIEFGENGGGGLRAGQNIDQKIMNIFLSLGIPPHLKGYQYLREAVKIVLDDPAIIYSITKGLYPKVADRFGVTPTKVELAMRHTLEVAWQRSKMDNINEVFGCDIYIKNCKPTNGEFIALVADKLATERNG
jgi:two-component system response regulator (stage 0 sporulation protein A)